MSYIFSHCSKLSSLPDISKWNISNVNDISEMFFNCDDLLSMKDDAKVNKEQVKAKSKYGLSISKKEEKKPFKIIDINRMFYE